MKEQTMQLKTSAYFFSALALGCVVGCGGDASNPLPNDEQPGIESAAKSDHAHDWGEDVADACSRIMYASASAVTCINTALRAHHHPASLIESCSQVASRVPSGDKPKSQCVATVVKASNADTELALIRDVIGACTTIMYRSLAAVKCIDMGVKATTNPASLIRSCKSVASRSASGDAPKLDCIQSLVACGEEPHRPGCPSQR